VGDRRERLSFKNFKGIFASLFLLPLPLLTKVRGLFSSLFLFCQRLNRFFFFRSSFFFPERLGEKLGWIFSALLLLSFFCKAEKRSEAKKTKKTEEAEKDKRRGEVREKEKQKKTYY
jgi:hypothetical protein